MTTLQQLRAALGGEISGGQLLCPGPGHSAVDRSLSVKLDADAPEGFIVNSFAADDPIVCRDHVREKAGLPAFKPNGNGRGRRAAPDEIERAVIAAINAAAMADTTTDSTTNTINSKIVATYDYTDSGGALLYQVVRYEPKDFRQRRPDGNDGWIWKLGEERVLYRLRDVIDSEEEVIVTEGEKDADRVAALGLCATTAAGGKWTNDCIAALAGRDVLVLEDNDEAGRAKALAAAQALHGTAKTIRIVSLPDLPDKGDVSDWLDADRRRGRDELIEVCRQAPLWTPSTKSPAAPPPLGGWKYYGDEAAPAAPRWLIKGLLPEIGAALLSGQWGTYKSTIATEMSVCIMSGTPFAGKYRIKRRGAVLFFALEGEGSISTHLHTVATHLGAIGPLPFAWRGDCPPLTSADALDRLRAIVDEAVADIARRFDMPVVLIWIDTIIAAANFASGEDNDASAAQKVMTTLRQLSQHTGALVVGVDHFGKAVETGTRGSSAKEGAADTVLAVLADRELSGAVKNTRLAVRKQRDGMSGLEIPFTVDIVETGVDEDSDPITAANVNWQVTAKTAAADIRWTPSMQLLRRILMTTLADSGKNIRPFLDGPEVRACDLKLVRDEFYRQHPADGTEEQKADARRKAFARALKGAQATDLIASREVDGVQLIWLTKPEAANA